MESGGEEEEEEDESLIRQVVFFTDQMSSSDQNTHIFSRMKCLIPPFKTSMESMISYI